MAERTYTASDVSAFRFTRAPWAEFSSFWPLPTPIAAGPWTFPTSEHLYQAAKFPAGPDVQARIAAAPTARAPDKGLDPAWASRRVAVMRWVLRIKRETNPAPIDAVLARSADRPIVEVSARDDWWSARPAGGQCRGHNVLGRLWMELCQQLRDRDPAAAAWADRAGAGRLRAPRGPTLPNKRQMAKMSTCSGPPTPGAAGPKTERTRRSPNGQSDGTD